MQQRLFVCPSCGRDTIIQPHRKGCPVEAQEERERQTNLKCREFGMEPYYTKPRPFPRQTGDP